MNVEKHEDAVFNFPEELLGNSHIKKYLNRILSTGLLSNLMLFAGPEGVGKFHFAETFAKMLLSKEDLKGTQRIKLAHGNHPDLRIFRPEGKLGMHSMTAVRDFIEEVFTPPYEAPWKVLIVEDADRMLSYSANALLKTLEEPLKQSLIILVSSSPDSLLSTILSRCRRLNFHRLSSQEIQTILLSKFSIEEPKAQFIASIAQGSISRAIQVLQEGEENLRGLILKFLSQAGVSSHEKISAELAEIARRFEESKKNSEEEVRKHLFTEMSTEISPVQRHHLEKEVEGIVSIRAAERFYSILETILGWFRDLHLLRFNGDRTHLLHPDFSTLEELSLQRGEAVSLEIVLKAIASARLSYERSTAFALVLENLMLQLRKG